MAHWLRSPRAPSPARRGATPGALLGPEARWRGSRRHVAASEAAAQRRDPRLRRGRPAAELHLAPRRQRRAKRAVDAVRQAAASGTRRAQQRRADLLLLAERAIEIVADRAACCAACRRRRLAADHGDDAARRSGRAVRGRDRAGDRRGRRAAGATFPARRQAQSARTSCPTHRSSAEPSAASGTQVVPTRCRPQPAVQPPPSARIRPIVAWYCAARTCTASRRLLSSLRCASSSSELADVAVAVARAREHGGPARGVDRLRPARRPGAPAGAGRRAGPRRP